MLEKMWISILMHLRKCMKFQNLHIKSVKNLPTQMNTLMKFVATGVTIAAVSGVGYLYARSGAGASTTISPPSNQSLGSSAGLSNSASSNKPISSSSDFRAYSSSSAEGRRRFNSMSHDQSTDKPSIRSFRSLTDCSVASNSTGISSRRNSEPSIQMATDSINTTVFPIRPSELPPTGSMKLPDPGANTAEQRNKPVLVNNDSQTSLPPASPSVGSLGAQTDERPGMWTRLWKWICSKCKAAHSWVRGDNRV